MSDCLWLTFYLLFYWLHQAHFIPVIDSQITDFRSTATCAISRQQLLSMPLLVPAARLQSLSDHGDLLTYCFVTWNSECSTHNLALTHLLKTQCYFPISANDYELMGNWNTNFFFVLVNLIIIFQLEGYLWRAEPGHTIGPKSTWYRLPHGMGVL